MRLSSSIPSRRTFGPPVMNRSSRQADGLRWWVPLTHLMRNSSATVFYQSPRYFYGRYHIDQGALSTDPPTFTLTNDGYVGACIDFDGPGGAAGIQYNTFGESDAPVLSASVDCCSLSAWFTAESLTAYHALISTRGGDDIELHLSGGAGNPLTYTWQNDGSDYDAATGLTISTDGRWYLGVMTIRPDRARVYTWDAVDGLRSYEHTAAKAAKTTGNDLYIGRSPVGSRYWDGKMADARLYEGRELQPADVLAMALPATRWELYGSSRRFWNYGRTAVAAGTGKPWHYYAQQMSA